MYYIRVNQNTMKKLIISELVLLFLATTFMTDTSNPGWVQLPINIGNRQITDIYFLDSLTGWVVTNGGGSGTDSALCLKTTNGGTNWTEQIKTYGLFNAVQFVDINTGYIAADRGPGFMLKSTNSGVNWIQTFNGGDGLTDLFFVNKDTGWATDPGGSFGVGIIKTANGGINWTQQLSGSFFPQKLFFINSDTGWAGSADWKLYRTTNSGQVWELQYTFSGSSILSLFFKNGIEGLVGGAGSGNIQYTTNGGFNWLPSQGEVGGYDIKFINDSVGFAGGGSQPLRILKTTNGGLLWGYQNAQAVPDMSVSVLLNDTSNAWAGKQLLIHTTDGGGPIIFTGIQQISTEIPTDFKLYQNYPNPFNPSTIIRFQIKPSAVGGVKSEKSNVKLVVYNVQGKELAVLVSGEYRAGIYEIDFSGETYSSGVYFYSLTADGKLIETKRMILLK